MVRRYGRVVDGVSLRDLITLNLDRDLLFGVLLLESKAPYRSVTRRGRRAGILPIFSPPPVLVSYAPRPFFSGRDAYGCEAFKVILQDQLKSVGVIGKEW